MGIVRQAAGAIAGGMGGGGFQGALEGLAGVGGRSKKRAGGTDVAGAGPIPFQEETSDQGSGEGATPRRKRTNGKNRG